MPLPPRGKSPQIPASLLADLWRLSPDRVGEHLNHGKFVRYPHIQFMGKRIAQTVAQKHARMVISMPPRHGKSWLISAWTPVWFLSHFPDRNVILTSYEADFAATWGRYVRNLIAEYGDQLGVCLMDDSKASNRWNTPQGGGMVTAGIGGPITGRGADLIIVDDPVKNWEQAMSELQRQKTIEWFNSTLYTRAEPGASILVLMTRWHERDLAGYLLNEHEDDWKELRLPARAEENDPLGREYGAPLCPERFGLDALTQYQKALGSQMWNALYQQRPSAQEGNLVKRDWWKFYRALPARFDTVIQSWDLAFKSAVTSDFVVGQVWGKLGPNKYLIDQVRRRIDFPDTIREVRNLSARYPIANRKLIEDTANGPALIAMLQKEMGGIIPVKPNGSKELRVSAVSAEIESGNVFLPDPATSSWVKDFIDEFANFPNCANDDQVDAASQALFHLKGAGIPFAPRMGKTQSW